MLGQMGGDRLLSASLSETEARGVPTPASPQLTSDRPAIAEYTWGAINTEHQHFTGVQNAPSSGIYTIAK